MSAILLSKNEQEELIHDILGANYDTNSNKYAVLSEIIENLGNLNDVATIAELIPSINAVFSGSATISRIMSGAAVAGIILTPVSHMISVINAYQSGHRHYAYRCIAYTVTAWSFNKAIPVGSNRILWNIRNTAPVRDPEIVDEFKKVWKKTSRLSLNMLQKIVRDKNIQKKHLQIIFQALGRGNEQTLCLNILKGFEKDLNTIEKMAWISNYAIPYPQ